MTTSNQKRATRHGRLRLRTGGKASGGWVRADQDLGSLPADWLPAARLTRAVVHRTAGSHRAARLDRDHDDTLAGADGKLIRGIPSIALNDAI